MGLKDKIKTESVEALKKGDHRRVEVLRYLVSLIDKREMQLPLGEMKEDEELEVLRKELKNKEESRAIFAKAGRSDLVEQQDYEIGVLGEYLPPDLNEEEVEKIIEEAMAEAGNNFGMVMKLVMGKVRGRVAGEVVARLVKQKLGQ